MRIDQFIAGTAVDRLIGVVLLVGLDGAILDANPAALACYGYTCDEILRLTIRDIRSPRDQVAISGQMRDAARREHLFEAEHRRSDGSTFPVEVRSAPVSIDGETGLFSIIHDITERRQAEAAHHEHELRLDTIIESTGIGTWEWNVQTGATIYNNEWARIVGYTLDELSPVSIATWELLAHPDDLVKSDELLQRHFAGELESYDFENRMRHKDGGLGVGA